MDMKPHTHDFVQFGIWLDEEVLPALIMVGVLLWAFFV